MNPNYPQGFYPQQPYGYQPPHPPHPPKQEIPSSARAVKIVFAILAPLLWFIALALPAYNDDVYGALCLVMGWSMLITGNILAFFAWFSNLPFWIGFFMFVIGNGRKGKIAALILAASGLMLSMGALTVSEVALNEGGSMSEAHVSSGMFVWMFAYVLVLVGSILFLVLNKNRNENPPMPPPPNPPAPDPYNPYPPVDPYAQYPPQDMGNNPWGNS